MDFFKQWCFCICVSLIIAVIFSLFTPVGRMKMFYKIMISLFVFVSFLYPFQNVSLSDINFDNIKATQESEANSAAYEDMVNKQITEALEKNGVKSTSVSSKISVDYMSGEVIIEKVRVAISDEYDKNRVKEIVFSEIGINAEVASLGE